MDGGTDKTPAIDTVGIDIGLKLKTDVPDGKIAFKNARIITMKGDEVIENGTIIIDQNKIVGHRQSSRYTGTCRCQSL